ncbi:hypothetical protein [Nonomuraea sp. B1E8]|uniref:hypothetical protein n=1 Tax=unclassified Nonomuraea TaxID=2593643 RepID=UPI00325E2FC7
MPEFYLNLCHFLGAVFMRLKSFRGLIWWKVALLGLILTPIRIAIAIADGERGVNILAASAAVITISAIACFLAAREYCKKYPDE